MKRSEYREYSFHGRCHKSLCPRMKRMKKGCKNIFQLFSLVIKTKVVQDVNRMSEREKDRLADRWTDRQKDRQTDRKTK